MDFKTFFIKKIMLSFFVSVTCICGAMALIGMSYEPDILFGYEAFWSPLIFGLLAALPLLVKYSKNELTMQQTLLRNLLHFFLLEISILAVLYFYGIITSIAIAISVAASILLIDLTVNLVLWINDKRTAREFNQALKTLQKSYGSNE